jgi:hypothetical protein
MPVTACLPDMGHLLMLHYLIASASGLLFAVRFTGVERSFALRTLSAKRA